MPPTAILRLNQFRNKLQQGIPQDHSGNQRRPHGRDVLQRVRGVRRPVRRSRVFLRITLGINEDHTGATCSNEFEVSDDLFGASLDRMVTCEMMKDQNSCRDKMPAVVAQLRQNSSVRLVLVLKQDELVVFKAIYTPQIAQPQVQSARVSVFDDQVCVYFQPGSSGQQVEVLVQIASVQLRLFVATNVNATRYCSRLSARDDTEIRNIVQLKVQLAASVTIGNEVVTDAPVTVLQSERHPFFIWAIAAILVVVAFLSVVGLTICSK
ncbi:Hypothetical_protein [Hexamita inflata]|uniref:Hypothetical_protein n=1 Tax=Hexamita inflata TaxID=28002 RepID=A0AA86R2P5_9EUKA|nr:Hypothetical protein HINF_LOCUS58281 [Hexamita inflata]